MVSHFGTSTGPFFMQPITHITPIEAIVEMVSCFGPESRTTIVAFDIKVGIIEGKLALSSFLASRIS